MPQGHYLRTQEELDHFCAVVGQMWLAGKKPRVEFTEMMGTRTQKQNSSAHLFFRQLAVVLNDGGFSVMTVLKHDAEIPWTETLVKEHLWRPVQEAMTGKESTTDANKVEYSDIHMALCRHLAQTLGVVCPPFPSESNQ